MDPVYPFVQNLQDKVVELIGGGTVINGAYPVYILGNILCAKNKATV